MRIIKNNFNKMDCCTNKAEKKQSGFLKGLFYGLTPHIFCIAFAVFTVLGSTVATTFLRPLMLNSYFFYILVGLSFVFAGISAIIYLKRGGILSFGGAKRKWRYLTILFGTTIAVNLLFFMVIFPVVANLNSGNAGLTAAAANASLASVTLEVAIPCSGHAPIITTELYKVSGVTNVKFRFPNLFDVTYDSAKTSQASLLLLEIFKQYKATVIE